MLFSNSKKPSPAPSTKATGDRAEAQALAHLEQAGLRLLERNYRTRGRGGGEIDLIMQDAQGTLVFVEVRQRRSTRQGGAAASISRSKQQRIIFAARSYLMRLSTLPACRFDVVAIDPDGLVWLPAAFDAA
jgi:putative endonuclease